MSDTERFVSPYLLRPCRSLQEVLCEQAERNREENRIGTPIGTASRGLACEDADEIAPHGE